MHPVDRGEILGQEIAGEGASHRLTLWLEHTIEVHPGAFVGSVALISTGLALFAILLSWLLYGREPLARRPDPLRRILGPIFTVFENKYWVDQVYRVLFVDRYADLARFLADRVDTAFLHDWFHDTVLARGFTGLTHFFADPIDLGAEAVRWEVATAIAGIVLGILGIIDGIANGLAAATKNAASSLRRVQNGFVRSYALAVLLGVVAILGYLLFTQS